MYKGGNDSVRNYVRIILAIVKLTDDDDMDKLRRLLHEAVNKVCNWELRRRKEEEEEEES